MTIFSIAFSPSDAYAVDTGALTANGAVEFWPGQWLMTADGVIADVAVALKSVRAAGGHLITRVDPAALDALMAVGVSKAGRLFFQEHAISAMIAAKPDRLAATGAARIGDMPLWLSQVIDGLVLKPTALRAPTTLCRTMLEQGSDKAVGWHNYGPAYSDILSAFPRSIRMVFELGLGSKNPDVPSNMGLGGTPGASLRGWSLLLPNAIIHGADIDRGILFQAPSIRTTYVDQLDPTTFAPMWADLGAASYDLMIDDGLHTFEAAAITLRNSIGMLEADGVYIIEDIVVADAERYVDLLRQEGLAGAFIDLPSLFNTHDNAMLIATRPQA